MLILEVWKDIYIENKTRKNLGREGKRRQVGVFSDAEILNALAH
jgi:hypothetical protein